MTGPLLVDEDDDGGGFWCCVGALLEAAEDGREIFLAEEIIFIDFIFCFTIFSSISALVHGSGGRPPLWISSTGVALSLKK